jgi:hypothetical protein
VSGLDMKNKTIKIFIGSAGLIISILTIIVFTYYDLSSVWNSWGKQADNQMIFPDWRYISLIWFKLCIYFIPPFFFAVSVFKDNKDKIKKNVFLYYLIKSLNHWFLILLSLKLIAESILEVDKIFGISIFNSIEDIQTLIGYILTAVLHRKIKIEPDEIDKKELKKTILR